MEVETRTENFPLKSQCFCTNECFCSNDNQNKLDRYINKIVEKTGFVKFQIEKKPLTTNGGNFLGILYEIDIKGKTKEGDKELNIFAKSIIPGHDELQVISVSNVYQSEVFIYNTLSKTFNELQQEAQVPKEERFKMVKSYDESNTEMIILENVSRRGFSTGHRMNVVSLKFAELAIGQLAKFHALSFVLKAKHPDFFEKKVKPIKSPYIFGKQWRKFVQGASNLVINNVDDDDIKETVDKFSKDVADRFERDYCDETTKRSLCHGDYRLNNIMVKEINGEAKEVIPVDYQMMSYGCPLLDFFYFIIFSTDREFRKAHLSYLKDLYHETMATFLGYFDLDVNLFYPREEFEKDYNEKLDHGLMLAITIFPFMFISEEDAPDVSVGVANESLRLDDRFKSRIRGIIDDYIEWGVI